MPNRYGVDVDYFKKELATLSRSLENRTPDELRRYLNNLANVVATPILTPKQQEAVWLNQCLKEDDDFVKQVAPGLRECFKTAPKANKGHYGDFLLEGVTDPEINLIDSEGTHLDFRVGPVYGAKGINKKLGLFVSFQRKHHTSRRFGSLLISAEIWARLNKEIARRFKTHKASDYNPGIIRADKPRIKE